MCQKDLSSYFGKALKIIIAPQAFKECATAIQAAEAIAKGIKRAAPKAKLILTPIADGGDGTLNVLMHAKKGTRKSSVVLNAIQMPKRVVWGILPEANPIVIIELASICGLASLPIQLRSPSTTTTFGVGQLIKRALDLGYRKFFIGLGGSATNDAGTGLCTALGVRFLDAKGKELPKGGAALAALDFIDTTNLDPRLKECEIIAGCDVNNPLIGSQGCTKIYANQKGAGPKEIEKLESSLKHFAAVVKRQFHKQIATMPFGGSAGGTSAGLFLFANAVLTSGVEWILDKIQFEHHLKNASLVIVAEGKLDGQTAYMKAPLVVAQHAKKNHIPVLALAGTLGSDADLVHKYGIDAYIPVSFPELKKPPDNALKLLEQAAEEAVRCFFLGKNGTHRYPLRLQRLK